MNKITIMLGGAVAALMLAACGGSNTSAAAGHSISSAPATPRAQPSSMNASAFISAHDRSWPGVGTGQMGKSGTTCDLLPSAAFILALPGSRVNQSWNGGADAEDAISVQAGVVFDSATDGDGNSVCDFHWSDSRGNEYLLSLDFIEHASQAEIWSDNPPGATCDDCTPAPVSNYSGGPAGMQYATWGVCTGVPAGHCVDLNGNPIKDDGTRNFEVMVPDGSSVLQFLGATNASEGMDVPNLAQVAQLAQVAIDRTPAFTPTNTLYGVGGSN